LTDRYWIFGYGSLIWKQDFPFLDARRAWIEGYERRFWQGSHDHRGTAEDPGRVLTLVETPGGVCHGRAFLIEGDVFEHLDHREKNGYVRLELPIHFGGTTEFGLTYMAWPGNDAYLGDAPRDSMARQIRRCVGESGRNLDYVIELADALRAIGIHDSHVFDIERLILDECRKS